MEDDIFVCNRDRILGWIVKLSVRQNETGTLQKFLHIFGVLIATLVDKDCEAGLRVEREILKDLIAKIRRNVGAAIDI